MIVFNYLGLGMLVLAMLIGYGIQGMAGNVDESGKLVAAYTVLVCACLIDLAYRWRHPDGNASRFLMPSQGGHVMFLPVWVCSALFAINTFLEIV